MDEHARLLAHPEAAVSELLCVKEQVRSLRVELRAHTELLDTLATPPWRRLWFGLLGYRLWSLGVWYRAPWNHTGHSDEDRR